MSQAARARGACGAFRCRGMGDNAGSPSPVTSASMVTPKTRASSTNVNVQVTRRGGATPNGGFANGAKPLLLALTGCPNGLRARHWGGWWPRVTAHARGPRAGAGSRCGSTGGVSTPPGPRRFPPPPWQSSGPCTWRIQARPGLTTRLSSFAHFTGLPLACLGWHGRACGVWPWEPPASGRVHHPQGYQSISAWDVPLPE